MFRPMQYRQHTVGSSDAKNRIRSPMHKRFFPPCLRQRHEAAAETPPFNVPR